MGLLAWWSFNNTNNDSDLLNATGDDNARSGFGHMLDNNDPFDDGFHDPATARLFPVADGFSGSPGALIGAPDPGAGVPDAASYDAWIDVSGLVGDNFATTTADNWGSFSGTADNRPGGTFAGGSLAVTGDANNAASFAIMADLTGFTDLALSWANRGTSTGFDSRVVEVSGDGGATFTEVYADTGTLESSWSVETVALGSLLADTADALIRFTLDGATSNFGNNRFDNIVLEGVELPAGSFDLQVTEIWPGNEPGSNLTVDWFEITNVGAAAWVAGVDPDLYYDDDSADPGTADLISGIVDIAPGESVIVLDGDASDVAAFIALWGPVIDLTGVEIGTMSGAGLSQGGDAVSLFVGQPAAGDTPDDFEAFPDAEQAGGQSWDVAAGAFALAGGTSGQGTPIVATAGVNDAGQPAQGSPGNGAALTPPAPTLVISEIMYDPNSAENDWEWVEVYNPGATTLDLAGWVIDDGNNVTQSAANIAAGLVAAGDTAILYNADAIVDPADFTAAWGQVPALIAVTNWGAMSLNNGGDTVALWSSFADYAGDEETFANAVDVVDYDAAGFPDPVGASIYLTDLAADNAQGANWAASVAGDATPAGPTVVSEAKGGNGGADTGSPGGPNFIERLPAPDPAGTLGATPLSSLAGLSGAEILAFDPASQRAFLVDGSATVQVLDFSDPAAPALIGTLTPPLGTDGANSVAVSGGLVAVAYQAVTVTDPGQVAFYDAATGAAVNAVTVGALPDMLTFTADGTRVVGANEGEPDGGVDPEGSVSIVTLDRGQADLAPSVATAGFGAFDAATLRADGVRIFPGKTVADDVEPEYITVVGDTAYVALQENNALAVVDIPSATVTEVRSLGTVDHSQPGSGIDPSDRDDVLVPRVVPVEGLRMPDAITSFTVGGQTYIATANEGDARDEDARVKNLTLDGTAFPDAAALQADPELGRLQVSTIDGDTDGDGDLDALFSYGTRSFSILDETGAVVFDSGDLFARILARTLPDPEDALDGRSDNKGSEPEGITFGEVDGTPYLFVGLERANVVLAFDVTDPANPVYDEFLSVDGAVSPEGLTFISAADSPTGQALLVVANEVSDTVVTYALGIEPTPFRRISEVQGTGDASPFEGEAVTVEGVIVAAYSGSGTLNGFFLQEEIADEDASIATSEGIFVFAPASSAFFPYAEGQQVRVTGTVDGFFGMTQITDLTDVQLVGEDALGLVAPAVVDLPAPEGLGIDAYLEQFEGMLTRVEGEYTVTELFNFARFGEVAISADGRLPNPTQIELPGSPERDAQADLNDRSRILLDDGRGDQNPDPLVNPANGLPFDADNILRAGDTFTDPTGALNFAFGQWRLQPVESAPFSDGYAATNPRPDAPEDVGGTLTVASFNVLNYFTTLGENDPDARGADNAFEFKRQVDKIVSALATMDADVVGLIEIENNGAFDLDGDPTTISALADLTARLNAEMGAGTYDFVETGQVGGDAITVAFIYKPDAVTLEGFAVLDDPAFTNPTGSSRGDLNRPALAASFTETATGETFTVVNNHLKSKGSPANDTDPNLGDGQGNAPMTRALATLELLDWLATDPTNVDDPDTLIVGDLNAYAREDAIRNLLDAGYTDLAQRFEGEDAYSFVFRGEWGTLDYALANESLDRAVTGATEWHINADEVRALDYNEEFKSPGQVASFYDDGPFRSSDHDPVIVGLQLAPNEIAEVRNRMEGTTGVDIFDSGAGRQDRMFSDLDGVTDTFVFSGDVTGNGRRDRDTIRDFEIEHDVLRLVDGAEIASIRESRGTLVVRFEGDGDVLRILGPDLDPDALIIETVPDLFAIA